MASGKSLELRQITKSPPEVLCICGQPYIDHVRKDGRGLLKKFNNDNHRPVRGTHSTIGPMGSSQQSLGRPSNRSAARARKPIHWAKRERQERMIEKLFEMGNDGR